MIPNMRTKIRKYFILVLISLGFIQHIVCECCISDYVSDNSSLKNCERTNDNETFELERSTKSIIQHNSLVFSINSYFSKLFHETNLSAECEESLILYVNELFLLKPWALEMFDAAGKPPSSMISQTMLDFGSLDDCTSIKIPPRGSRVHSWKGQYCLLQLQHPLFQTSFSNKKSGKAYIKAYGYPPDWISNMVIDKISNRFGLYIGICTPSACSQDELNSIVNAIADPMDINSIVTDCQMSETEKSLKWSLLTKLSLTFLLCFAVVCVIGTLLDLQEDQVTPSELSSLPSLSVQLLKAFSLYSNLKNLFTIPKKKTNLDFIHGFRLILCLWVMLGHYVVFPSLWKEMRYRNLEFAHDFMIPEVIMVVINNGLIVVEGFFFFSGFLLVHSLWKNIEKNKGTINIFEAIFSRYRRLTIPHIFLLILVFALPTIHSGPIWNSTWEHETTNCLQNGWKNLIYSQNSDGCWDICWVHTWYICVAMQLVVIFIPLMVLTYKFPKLGIFLSFAMQLGSMIHTYNTSIKNELSFVSYNSLKTVEQAFVVCSEIYVTPYKHYSSHFVGILLGFVLRYKKRQLSTNWLIVGWTLSAVCFITALYGVHYPTENIKIYALYNATRSLLFCLGLAWISYACVTGNGGIVNKILSSGLGIPLSRISYSVYLVHPIILVIRDACLRERLYMDKVSHVIEVIPYGIASLLFGMILYVTVEEPFNDVYDLVMRSFKTPNKNHSIINQTDNMKSENSSIKEKIENK